MIRQVIIKLSQLFIFKYKNWAARNGINFLVAHFHFPPEWVNATAINNDTYIDAIQILTNEIDFPQMSAGTGMA